MCGRHGDSRVSTKSMPTSSGSRAPRHGGCVIVDVVGDRVEPDSGGVNSCADPVSVLFCWTCICFLLFFLLSSWPMVSVTMPPVLVLGLSCTISLLLGEVIPFSASTFLSRLSSTYSAFVSWRRRASLDRSWMTSLSNNAVYAACRSRCVLQKI
jgi:hypothetical protein